MNPNYYAIIPANVRYDNRLTPNAKLLYGEITALCNKEGFCWAKNDYFSNLYKVEVRTITRWISDLKKCDFIDVSIDKLAGNKRKITLATLTTKMSIPRTKMSIPIDKNVNTSIYSINNTINTPESALHYSIKNYPIRFEQEFLMPFEKQFKTQEQFDMFLKDFNDEAEMKDKAYDSWLIPMLKKYCRKWLAYQGRMKVVGNEEKIKESSKHLGNAI